MRYFYYGAEKFWSGRNFLEIEVRDLVQILGGMGGGGQVKRGDCCGDYRIGFVFFVRYAGIIRHIPFLF